MLRRPDTLKTLGLFSMIVLGVLPFALARYQISFLSQILALSIFALSLDLIWGYTGLLSFGHAAFFGLGAYTMGLVLKHLLFPNATLLGLLLAVALPTLLALGLGFFLFYGKVAGAYFAVITLAVALIFQQIAISWVSFTGGFNGFYGYAPMSIQLGPFEWVSSSVTSIYYVVLIGVIFSFLFSRAIVNSKFGRVIVAVKENSARTESLGYNVEKTKLIIYGLSAALGGFAGALYAPAASIISPDLFGLILSTDVIIWVTIGGRGTLIGPIIGTLIVRYFEYYISGLFADIWLPIVGVFFVLIVIFVRQGIAVHLLSFLRKINI